MAMRIEGGRVLHDAEWAQGEMSYSLVNSVYSTVFSNVAGNDFLAIDLINTTNQPAYFTFDATQDQFRVGAGSEKAIALANLQRKHSEHLQVRAEGTLPTSGKMRAELLKR